MIVYKIGHWENSTFVEKQIVLPCLTLESAEDKVKELNFNANMIGDTRIYTYYEVEI